MSTGGSNTVQYVLVGENGEITPLGHPVLHNTQVSGGEVREAHSKVSPIREKLETWTWALTAPPRQNLKQTM